MSGPDVTLWPSIPALASLPLPRLLLLLSPTRSGSPPAFQKLGYDAPRSLDWIVGIAATAKNDSRARGRKVSCDSIARLRTEHTTGQYWLW
jgi:hypothetical protein